MYKLALDLDDLYVTSFATASTATPFQRVGGDSESSSDEPAWMCTCDKQACLQTETTSD